MNKPVDRPPLIRLAVPADAEALSALILRTIRESNAEDYPPDEIERVCTSFTPEEVTKQIAARDVFVSFAPGASQEPSEAEPVGTVSLGVKPQPSGGETAKLHVLFVAPEWQGHGLGLRLVAHLEAHALRQGHRLLQVSSSLTARQFYQRLGYRELAFEPRAEGSTYLMEKSLV